MSCFYSRQISLSQKTKEDVTNEVQWRSEDNGDDPFQFSLRPRTLQRLLMMIVLLLLQKVYLRCLQIFNSSAINIFNSLSRHIYCYTSIFTADLQRSSIINTFSLLVSSSCTRGMLFTRRGWNLTLKLFTINKGKTLVCKMPFTRFNQKQLNNRQLFYDNCRNSRALIG